MTLNTLRNIVIGLCVIAFLAVVVQIGYNWGKRSQQDRIADLVTQLAKASETIELTTDLYAKQTVQVNELMTLLDIKDARVAALKQVLDEMGAQLLTVQQVSLRWKKAYEALLESQQSEEPPTDPDGVPRKRVDFAGTLGPIRATGHTLTDPPETFLKLEQVLPLVLTVSVAQNKDKSWTSFVTTSDSNIDVKVDVAGVNPLVLHEKWYQRFWVETSVNFLGDMGASIGLSWRGDRASFGASCMFMQGFQGCGPTAGIRLWK